MTEEETNKQAEERVEKKILEIAKRKNIPRKELRVGSVESVLNSPCRLRFSVYHHEELIDQFGI